MQCYMMYRMAFVRLFTLCIFINYAASQDYHDNATVYNEDLTDSDTESMDFGIPFLNRPFFNNANQVNGQIVVEGDILLPKGVGILDWISDFGSRAEGDLWKDGVIYYTFDTSVREETQKLVFKAIETWENISCLKFEKCVDTVTCVTIFETGVVGCNAQIGSFIGGQNLNLGYNCDKLNIIIHELGHSIGFHHEQGRFDRDEYVTISEHNVGENHTHNFEKKMEDWDTEYDYSSIMHYDENIFSIDAVRKHTIVPHNPHYQFLMGNSKHLSFRDIRRVNRMYDCSDACPNKGAVCENDGYLTFSKYDYENCYCDCPPHITGTYCEHKPENYDYYNLTDCNKNITEPSDIETPGYPERNITENCSYWIQAPEGKRIEVEFEDFSFDPRATPEGEEEQCYFEKVEIRHEDDLDGELYCDEELKGQTLTSTSNNFIIIIGVLGKATGRRGIKAHVNFV